MPILIGLAIVAVIILYKRSTGIVTVNPLSGARPTVQRPDGAEEKNPQSVDFAGLIGTIRGVAQATGSSEKGRAAIKLLVQNDRMNEAAYLYRRVYGVDLPAARAAVEEMTRE